MSKTRTQATTKVEISGRVVVAVVLAWLVPGAGHWYIGERGRGIVFFCAISATFWIGAIIGGAHNTINLQENTVWFFAQIFTGVYTIITGLIGRMPGALPSYEKTLDLATIYTGIAGLSNALVILDVLARSAIVKSGTDQGKQI